MSLRYFVSAIGAVLLAACAGIAAPAWAQATAYPVKPLRLVVPYPPGGTADILGRLLAERLGPQLGQTVLVENRAGGGTAIGARYVAAAAADGYTLFIGTSTSHAINPALQPDIGYHPVRDFTALAAITEVPYAIVAHPSRGFKTLDDLVQHARAHPGKLDYSSAGAGSSNHLGGELLAHTEKLDIVHIPYKGSAPALNDLLSGQVDFMFDLAPTSQQHVRAGALVPLAVTGTQRSPVFPDVPTVAEAGFPQVQITAWFGLFGPAGLPVEVQERLTGAVADVLGQPDVQERLRTLGTSQMAQSGPEFARFVEEDHAHWSAFIGETGIRLE